MFVFLCRVISQGTDSVVRQTSHHMALEVEWVYAFILQGKLEPILTLVGNWCASDRQVLIESMRAALEKFQAVHGSTGQMPKNLVRLLNCSQLCFDYDVFTQPVSVHLPLSRMISALLLALPKQELEWNSSELSSETKPTILQLMEAPLRLQAMIAQVRLSLNYKREWKYR